MGAVVEVEAVLLSTLEAVCGIIYRLRILSMTVHTMDFKKATDALFARLTHEDLAEALGVSVPSIRQARLGVDSAAHRGPPQGWERAVLRLAERQERYFHNLKNRVRGAADKK